MVEAMDRRAILIGCWHGFRPPFSQKTRGLVGRMGRALSGELFAAVALNGIEKDPTTLFNPSLGQIVNELEAIQNRPTAQTELIFYYLGHSVPCDNNGLNISIGQRAQISGETANEQDPELRPISLQKVLNQFVDHGFQKITMILDTCHSGRVVKEVGSTIEDYVIMTSAGSSYSYDADFSNALIPVIERPVTPKDQRVDRRLRGITFRRLFESARARLPDDRLRNPDEAPVIGGPREDEVFHAVPLNVPEHINRYASSRSIYYRVFSLLEILADKPKKESGLIREAQSRREFLFRVENEESISEERIREYISFCQDSGLIVREDGKLKLTDLGTTASLDLYFNSTLLKAIEKNLLPPGVDFEVIESVIQRLSEDALPPTPNKIATRLRMDGLVLEIGKSEKLAFKLLPSTRRFEKGSADALYLIDAA